MGFIRRRKLQGVPIHRFSVGLPENVYGDLQLMKGELGNSAAIERLILEKKARLGRGRPREERQRDLFPLQPAIPGIA